MCLLLQEFSFRLSEERWRNLKTQEKRSFEPDRALVLLLFSAWINHFLKFSRYRSLLLVKYFLHGHHLLILPISKPSGEGLYNHLWHNKDDFLKCFEVHLTTRAFFFFFLNHRKCHSDLKSLRAQKSRQNGCHSDR